ncbi:AAA domain-containing protein [Paenibacillus sp. T1]|uniref:AAA domain-containing protein n=1 Tax=Paenibacillus glycinis TaxID=2697035 RepID=A0ABW9XKS7_9BACL|nr:AAA domain-containing protein [Paenibacillus glycinis]
MSPARPLTADERALVWSKPPTHQVSAEERRICREVKRNWNSGEMKIATILLEGDAGSGKTQLAKALSADFGLPYTKITCFADMDKSDVIGAILPVLTSEGMEALEPEDRAMLKALYESDGFASASLTLAETFGFSPEEAAAKLKRLMKTASASAGSEAVEYRFYPSEIVRAYRQGYLLEIQEPTVIRDAAVLMALNSALEPDGALNLPTGILRRHPDFIAVITTNRSYAGVRPLNEALRDRVQHSERMDLPAKSVMIERAMAKTGYRNERTLNVLADAIMVLDHAARAHAIKGVAGMRSYFYWADAVAGGVDARESLYHKVIYKISTDPADVGLLEEALERRGLLAELDRLRTAPNEREVAHPEDRGHEQRQDEVADRNDIENDMENDMEANETELSGNEDDDAESIAIKTWGAVNAVSAEQDKPTDEQGIRLKKSADSEEGSAGEAGEHAAMERSETVEDGGARYHQANPDAAPADAERAAREHRKKLNKVAREAVNASMHQAVRLVVHRPGHDAESEREYERYRSELMPIVREIAGQALPLLEHETASEFARNQYSGSKFQADSVAYRDYRHFAKKRPPSESPSLAVALRVDESASMSAFGRLEAAKRAALAVYEFCRLCGIPVLIYGDTADVSRLEQMSIYAYADLEAADANDRFRLMSIRARSNNRDGMALRIIADRLAAAPQRTKLLISVSDGQPKAMEDYAGGIAVQDMQAVIAEYERRGIAFLAAAIGQDKDVIGRIYGSERFLDITDLEELPGKLVRLIARHL